MESIFCLRQKCGPLPSKPTNQSEVKSREYPSSRPSLLGLASNSDSKELHKLDFFAS